MKAFLSPVYVEQFYQGGKEIVGIAFGHSTIPDGQKVVSKLLAIDWDSHDPVAVLENGDRFMLGYYMKF